MIRELSTMAKMRTILWEMETGLGLDQLSQSERDVLYAFRLQTEEDEEETGITRDRVRRYPTVAEMPHATFHRAFSKLVSMGLLEQTSQGRASNYRLKAEAPRAPA